MKRKSFENDGCPATRSLEAVGDTWSMLIVRPALAGDRRFGEFEKSLGTAKNILADRLRKLDALGVLRHLPVEGERVPRVRADRDREGCAKADVAVSIIAGQGGFTDRTRSSVVTSTVAD
jgi:hypothetical protein